MKKKQPKKIIIGKTGTIILAFVLVIMSMMITSQNIYAKTHEMYTLLAHKSNPKYKQEKERGGKLAYKVKLKRDTIVIYGSLNNITTGRKTKIGKHTYRLADDIEYTSRGGEDPETIYTKNEFKDYLKRCDNVFLALILKFKNGKVTKLTISS